MKKKEVPLENNALTETLMPGQVPYRQWLCPIGHKDKKTRHTHGAISGIFDHEESLAGFARIRLGFQRKEFPEKGVVVTAAFVAGVHAMGTNMPNSYYKKHNLKPNSHPERARKIGKRLIKLLKQSRMVEKIK